jgi:hypothetical protein
MRGPGGRNLTEGPIASTLILFSLPMLGGNILQQLNVTANQFWVAHLLGATDITAIGNANSVMMLMMGAIFGATMAANILIAQQVGAGDLPLVKRIMGTAVFFFFVISITLSLTGGIFAPHILTAMRTPPAARAEAIVYLRVVFAAMPFMYFFQFLQMAQRGAGDSRTPFYFMGLAVVLDIILNPLLIAGIGPFPKLGVAGSATSTLIGQGVSLVLLLITLYRRHSVLMLKGRELRYLWPSLEILRPLVFRGIPMSLQMFIMSAAGMMMITFVNGFGAVTSAAYVGALQVWNYIQMAERRRRPMGAGRAYRHHRPGPQRRGHRHHRRDHLPAGPAAALHLPAGDHARRPFVADHPARPAHRPHGALGLRDLQRHLRPFRHCPFDRRGVAAAADPDGVDAGDPGAVRLLPDPAFRHGGDLVELPARHPDLQRADRALLSLRQLAEGADAAPWAAGRRSRRHAPGAASDGGG